MGKEEVQRFKFNLLTQRSIPVYSFVMSANDLINLARVDRFGESSDGVNRKLNEKHALDIAQAMIDGEAAMMLDAICGDLQGNWEISNGFLVPSEDAFLSIDDGQHRWYAVTELLVPEERERWSFNVVATMGLDLVTRLRIFRQQKMRKPIDSRLDLAQRHVLDEWRSEAEREAYNLILVLNSETGSPLKGMIVLEETVKRPYEHQHRVAGINANGLWQSMKSVMGKNSPLFSLSIEKRVEVIRNMILLASETWPTAWGSDEHILSTARGINAVLMLMVSSPEFRGVIGDDFRVESLRRAFQMAKRFSWKASAHKNASVREITDGLNQAIKSGRARQGTADTILA